MALWALRGAVGPARRPGRANSADSGTWPNSPSTPREWTFGCSPPTRRPCVVLVCPAPCPSRRTLPPVTRLARCCAPQRRSPERRRLTSWRRRRRRRRRRAASRNPARQTTLAPYADDGCSRRGLHRFRLPRVRVPVAVGAPRDWPRAVAAAFVPGSFLPGRERTGNSNFSTLKTWKLFKTGGY